MKTTIEIIRDLREDNDLTQVRIAKELQISQQQYSAYESGKIEFPVRHLIALAEFYGVSVDYLLGLTEFSGRFTKFNAPFLDGLTIGELLNQILTLNVQGRKSLVEYIDLLKLKEEKKHQNQND